MIPTRLYRLSAAMILCLPPVLSAAPAWADAPPPAAAVQAGLPPIATARKDFDPALLAPVDGLDLRTYAHVVYAKTRAPDTPEAQDQVLARFGVTKEQFEAANKTFADRMQADPSYVFISIYGAYFIETADGPYARYAKDAAQSVLNRTPLAEPEPMPEEAFRDIQSYVGRKSGLSGSTFAQMDELLKPKDLTFNDFQILGAWFSQRLNQAHPVSGEIERPAQREEGPRVEVGGLWRLQWQLLKRGAAGMTVEEKTAELCLKSGMTAGSLPITPHPANADCTARGDAYRQGDDIFNLSFDAQCDHGSYGTFWMLVAEEGNETGFKGKLDYTPRSEEDPSLEGVMTPLTGVRIGDCTAGEVAAAAADETSAELVQPPEPRPGNQPMGLSPGKWEVRLRAPTLAPHLTLDDQRFEICYTKADARRNANPILLKGAGCDLDYSTVGDSDVYDATCPDSYQELRMSYIGPDLYRGTYRYMAQDSDLMLEPRVELRRLAENCE